jgi:hypothetical protein
MSCPLIEHWRFRASCCSFGALQPDITRLQPPRQREGDVPSLQVRRMLVALKEQERIEPEAGARIHATACNASAPPPPPIFWRFVVAGWVGGGVEGAIHVCRCLFIISGRSMISLSSCPSFNSPTSPAYSPQSPAYSPTSPAYSPSSASAGAASPASMTASVATRESSGQYSPSVADAASPLSATASTGSSPREAVGSVAAGVGGAAAAASGAAAQKYSPMADGDL